MPEKKCQTMVACLFKGSIYFNVSSMNYNYL